MEKYDPTDYWKEILQEYEILKQGHFILRSGRHSEYYIEKAELYPNTHLTADLCFELAQMIVNFLPEVIEIVVGPAQGGIVLSQWTAYYLQEIYQRKVLALFTEKDSHGKHILQRGYKNKIKDKPILIVDDVITTGSTLQEITAYLQNIGGKVLACACLFKRRKTKIDLKGIPLYYITKIELSDWEPKDCPLCSQRIPITPLDK